jgi:hypothetical protein
MAAVKHRPTRHERAGCAMFIASALLAAVLLAWMLAEMRDAWDF